MATEVFISYSRGDGAFVEQLNRLLQTAGVSTWFDRVNLLPGMKWADVIDDEIPAARVFLACLSPTALDERGYFQVEQQLAAKAALHVPSDRLFIIPVLLSDCTLPRELRQYHTANLFEPGAIQALLSSISDALGRRVEASVESVTELRDALRKHMAAAGPFGSSEFTDPEVKDVVDRLREMHARQGVEFLDARDLLPELDLLFNRKTFRYEALRRCPEQRWSDRLDSAYQTLKVFQAYLRNVRATTPEKYPIYRDLVMELDKYCMQMGSLLFDPGVDYNDIEAHIGKSTFKGRLPKGIRFPVGNDRQPDIPDSVNEMIDPHRVRAVELMDQLLRE